MRLRHTPDKPLQLEDDLTRDLWADRQAGRDVVDFADLFNDRADASAAKGVVR